MKSLFFIFFEICIFARLYPKHGPAPRMPDAESESEDEDEDYLSVRAHYDV
jgi:hypothetical protein